MPIQTDKLVQIIARNKSKKLAASTIIESNPADLPVLPKLISDDRIASEIKDERIQLNRAALEGVYRRIAAVKNNNENIIQLFPDIELAIQILVSSILSPKKMTSVQLNYRFSKNLTTNPTVTAGVLEAIKTYVEDTYKIEGLLPDIVREALFTSGACVYAVVSESAVDEIINSDLLPSYGMEDYKQKVDRLIDTVSKPINLLNLQDRSPKPLPSKSKAEDLIEYLASESRLHLTDNIGMVHYGSIKEKITSKILREQLKRGQSISTESLEKIEYLDIFRSKSNSVARKEVEFVKRKNETFRKNIGRPMLMKLPTESVIPVFVPGNEKEHSGYFVLLDENNKPLSGDFQDNDLARLDATLHKTSGNLTPVQKAYNNLVSNSTNGVDINILFEMYKKVLEKQLFGAVKSSLNGKTINIAEKNDIYFLMFSRALQDQKTSILYLPKELVVYFAFQYTKMGTGKSLLENLAVQTSLRAILLFAKVMAYAKQSIDVTKVNIQLDPHDPDPEKTIEQVQSSVLKLRQNFLPLGINNPVDLVNWIQRAGLQFSYENNPQLPNVNLSFENNNLSHTLPSSDLEEDLRKQTIIAIGLPPETVDNGFSPEFARTVINNNILLSKRVSVYQEKLNADVSKFVSAIVYNDEDIRKTIRETLLDNAHSLEQTLEEEEKQLLNKDKEAFLDYYVDKICENLYIELPKPEDTDITNLSEEFNLYKENLNTVLDSVISAELLSENVSGDISQDIETLRTQYYHYLLRKWMSDNNYYPEALDIASGEFEDVDNLIAVLSQHLQSTMRNGDKLLRVMKDFRLAVNKDLEETFDGQDLEGSSADSGGSSSSNDSESEEPSEEGNEDDGLGGDVDDLLKF